MTRRLFGGFYLLYWFAAGFPLGGPDYYGKSDEQKYYDPDRHRNIHFGRALVDVDEWLIRGLWVKSHGIKLVEGGR